MNILPKILKTCSFVIATLFITMNAMAQDLQIIVGNDYVEKNSVIFVGESEFATIKFSLNELNLIDVETDYGKMQKMVSADAPFIIEAGNPELIYLSAAIIIPNTGSTEIQITYGEYVEFEKVEIAPSKGHILRNVDPSSIPYRKGEVYEVDDFFPRIHAEIDEPFIMRDHRGQRIVVYPVQYNPVTKVLRVYSEITVTAIFNDIPGVNEFSTYQKRHETIEPEFDNMYSRLFLNHSTVQANRSIVQTNNSTVQTRSYPTREHGELLVICHPSFMDAMKPYVDWKRTIGRKTTMVSTSVTGATSISIKNYISSFYNNPNNNLAYVLLVGDHAQIPTHMFSNTTGSPAQGGSDLFYGQLVGSDPFLEVLVGRFSAESVAHVQTQVQRTINYERDLTTSSTWLSRAIGLAANEGSGFGHDGGEADHVHMNNIRNRKLTYGYNTVFQEYTCNVPGISNTNVTQISSRFNTGVGVVNFCNHGSEISWAFCGGVNYSNAHVSALQNAGMLPYIFSVACVNGRFMNTTCFAEAWLRATQNNQPTGAMAAFMSTVNLSWLPPMTAQDVFVNICMDLPSPYPGTQPGIMRTFAGAALNATQKMMIRHGSAGSVLTDFNSWLVFGDPTLMFRTRTPQAMTVSHSSNIQQGTSFFNVTCNVNGALVTMSYTDGNRDVHILGTATVANGVANLTFPPITSQFPITIAVTARDRVTYLRNINVVGGGCVTIFSSQTVSTNTTIHGCSTLTVHNVTVTNGAKLTIISGGDVTFTGSLNLESGSQLEIL